jgi:hypothetical protein
MASPGRCVSDQKRDRPDICVGTDLFHTPAELVDEVIEGSKGSRYTDTVALNRPFAVRSFRQRSAA